jgi:hypothetical protein
MPQKRQESANAANSGVFAGFRQVAALEFSAASPRKTAGRHEN